MKFLNRSPLLRKSFAFARQVPRLAVRMTSRREDYLQNPPCLANSVPKSGTHLLLQVLRGIPGTRYFGSFIASLPALTMQERSERAQILRMRALVPGEAVGAHIHYSPRYAEILEEMNAAHFFIYRDPRDIVVSEALYLARMSPWHRLHKTFATLPNDDERIAFAITGDQNGVFPFPWGNIAERYGKYLGWMERKDVCSLRFEDLNGERRKSVVRRIVEFYASRTSSSLDIEETARLAMANIDPEKSHTFRSGIPGGWRNKLNDRNIELIRELAGDLLVRLGYEADLNWGRDPEA